LVTSAERQTLEEQRFMEAIPDGLFECIESRVYLELADLLRKFILSGKFAEAIAKEIEKKEKKKTKEEGKRWGKKAKTQPTNQRSEILGDSRVDRLERSVSRSLHHSALQESSQEGSTHTSSSERKHEYRTSMKAVPFSHRQAPSQSTTNQDFVFVCCGVGDCKAYAYLKDERRVVDFTSTSRAWSKNDATDPGGRLGPFKQQKHPDLRNLHCSSISLKEGDLILLVSDGVHDNLDPEHLGKSPSDCNLSETSWMDESAHIHRAKVAYAEQFLLELIESEGTSPTPEFVTQKVIAHAKKTTKAARKWLENNDRRLPKDYVAFPGKMDHTSCVCFLVTDDDPQAHLFSQETIVDSETEEAKMNASQQKEQWEQEVEENETGKEKAEKKIEKKTENTEENAEGGKENNEESNKKDEKENEEKIEGKEEDKKEEKKKEKKNGEKKKEKKKEEEKGNEEQEKSSEADDSEFSQSFVF